MHAVSMTKVCFKNKKLQQQQLENGSFDKITEQHIDTVRAAATD